MQDNNTVDPVTARILADPRYEELKSKRTGFGGWLTLAMLVVYYGFILLVAFDKPFLATRLGEGVTTIGMPIVVTPTPSRVARKGLLNATSRMKP